MSNYIVRRPNVQIAELGPGLVALTGPLDEVDYALRLARRAGTVVGDASRPVRADRPGEWMVTARRAPLVQRPVAAPARREVPWRWIAVGGTVALVLLAALCAAGAIVGMWLLAHLAQIVVLLAIVAWAINRATGGRVVEVFVRVSS